MENNTLKEISSKLSANLQYLGFDFEELKEEGFISRKAKLITVDHFQRISNSKNPLDDLLIDLNRNDISLSNNIELRTIINNMNDIYTFIYSLKNDFIEARMKFNYQKNELDEINSKLGFELLSIEHLEKIQNSFLEENPPIKDFIQNLMHLKLSDICKITNEETIKQKLLKH